MDRVLDYRFDSHGCTRVDNVCDLAAWILEDVPGWNRDAIDAGIARGHLKLINLPHRMPVAWVPLPVGWPAMAPSISATMSISTTKGSIAMRSLTSPPAISSRAKLFASWKIRQNSHLDAAKRY
jgi:hypothetical protein